ncbi:MAG: hypothetical protein IRY95_04835, partial [Clostridia bacterium]|nr:hypothetical protein [Clostridia bacterium]
GWDRARVRSYLHRRARLPVDRLAPAARRAVADLRRQRGEPEDEPLPVALSPDDIALVVTGGVGVKATFIPTWGGGTRSVTVPVEDV